MKVHYKSIALLAAALIPLLSQAGSIGFEGIRDHDGLPGADLPGLNDKEGSLPPGWIRNGGPSWLNDQSNWGADGDNEGHGLPHHDYDRDFRGHGYHGGTTDTDRPTCNRHGRAGTYDGTNTVPDSESTAMLLGGALIALFAWVQIRPCKTHVRHIP